jgi:hypothetical protein
MGAVGEALSMVGKWFQRFGDTPGVSYTTPAGIDRRRLPHADAQPQIHTWDDERHLSWPGGEGSGVLSTSASPAHQRAFGTDLAGMSTVAALQHLGETLELPGEPTDYHFAIQNVLEALWKRRRTEPTVLTTIEQLAWLDLNLAEARPDSVSTDVQGEQKYYTIRAFQYLITLYEREGALREALEVAGLAVRYEQQQAKRDELVGRVTALGTEEVG